MSDDEARIRRRLVETGRLRLKTLADRRGASIRIIDKADDDERPVPGEPVSMSIDAEPSVAGDWMIHVRRQPHHTEGSSVRKSSGRIVAPDGEIADLADATIDRLMDPVARLQRRDATLRRLGFAIDAPPPWAFTMHKAALLMLRHHRVDMHRASTPANHVTDRRMVRWPSREPKGIQTAAIGTRTFDLELVDLIMKGLRIEARTIDVRRDRSRLIEIEQVGTATQIVIHDQVVPETVLQAMKGRDLSAIAHPAYAGETGIAIRSAINGTAGIVVRLEDVQVPLDDIPDGIRADWLD